MNGNGTEELVSALSFMSVFLLLLLPFEKINGNPIPTIIFNDRAAYFHAVVLGFNFAFCGGIVTISVRQIYPKVAYLCRLVSVLSMMVALGMFLGLGLPWVVNNFMSSDYISISSA